MSVTEFIIIRHGETVWNREGRIQGHLDSPLNGIGLAQAAAIGSRLAGEAFDALYSSDLGRARQTAERIAQCTGHPIRSDARLRERHLGVLQSLTRPEAERLHPEAYSRYRHDGSDYALPGGESARQCFERNLACLEEIAARHPGARAVVVTHGGVLDGVYRRATGLPFEGPRMFSILNASLNVFRYRAGEWSLTLWGDISHLGATALDDA
ncbi:MAG: histidine phosphatase family protein [Betaproteobacteria bacterium]|nr:histidine phosphatase family protein [Betaproteobacteria bacterium]